MDPYEVRFTFFWYNDQEIFFDTQEEIDAKVGRIADQGITHLSLQVIQIHLNGWNGCNAI